MGQTFMHCNLHKVTEGITRSIVYGFIKQQKIGNISF